MPDQAIAHDTGAPNNTDPTLASQRQVAVVLPYAVSIRDFVGSGLLSELVANPSVRLTVYTLNPELPELEPARASGVELRQFVPHADSRLEAILKGLYLYLFSDQFVYIEQGLAGRPSRKLLASMLVALRKIVGTGRFLTIYERMMLAIFRRSARARQIEGTPDLIIGTRSLLNSIDYGLMAEARTRGIPILTLAGSWDNFTTKGFFPFAAKRIVVWNAKMQQELADIFAVPATNVLIAGYPRQASLMSLASGMDAETYLRSIGIEGYSRFVLYAASYSELTRVPGRSDPLEYEVMLAVCRKLEQTLPEDVCLVLRLHPFSDPEGKEIFESLTRSFVFVPGRKDVYVERVMGPDDEVHLARQIALSECVVSLASTMTIDALSLGKAVINTRFDPEPGLPYKHSNVRFFAYNHFRDIARLVDLPMAEDADAVVDFVEQVMAGAPARLGDMAAFEKWYVPDHSSQFPQKVAALVDDILARSAITNTRDHTA
ncbi:MAG: hypothetical protein ACK4NZ_08305 [Tsuneonella sp.]